MPRLRFHLPLDIKMLNTLQKFLATLRWYGIYGSLRLAWQFIRTKLTYPEARLLRSPLYIRSVKRFVFGRGFTSGVGLRLDVMESGVIRLGQNIQVNDHVHIAAVECVEIGDNCLIASRVYISDHNHGRFDIPHPLCIPSIPPAERPLFSRPVYIGSNVWIGEAACVLPGVTIGSGAVVGAGSIVTHDVPPDSVVAGIPAKVTRRFNASTGQWDRVK